MAPSTGPAAPATVARSSPSGAASAAPVILASGPGGTAYDEAFVRQLQDGLSGTGPRAVAVGSATAGFSLDDLAQQARDVAQRGGRPSLVIHAHGKQDGDGHAIEAQPDRWVPSGVLFSRLRSELGDAPVDVFATSCHGGAASEAANRLLPPGSTFVALAPSSETVAGGDVEALASRAQAMALDLNRDQQTSASELLLVYLTQALQTRIAPEVTVAGQGTRRLGSELASRSGRPFSSEERARVDEALTPLVGADETRRIVEAIQSSRDEWSIPAADYGKALAACFAAGASTEGAHGGDLERARRANTEQMRKSKHRGSALR